MTCRLPWTGLLEEFGGLNVAFNNAGLASTGSKAADESEADWQEMIDTKLNGVWRGMKCQVPAMLEAGGGAIVNMAGNWGPDRVSHLCRVLRRSPRGYGTDQSGSHGIRQRRYQD